ncbi:MULTISPECIES: LysR substrate-binding domain-containing protein [unclassified Sinorhizobium]|uniref:LysR substrate-binding domain-containing protein n=1 Tax=unclassified Sinorhizobium TaxID=2613772 RepID=UPI003523C092
MNLDSNWLADLKALAECLNFSRAAENRHVTQPAFGRRIKSLERWAGEKLVDRSTHRLKLTPAGEIMLGAAQDVIRRLELARSELDQLRFATTTLTFAATHALSFTFFPGWMERLTRSSQSIPIRLLSDHMSECERLMLEGKAQFLLCHYHPDSRNRLADADFLYLELASDQLIPVSGRDQSGKALHVVPAEPDTSIPLLAFEETSGMGRILASTLFNHMAEKLRHHTVFTSHLAMALRALATEGKGVAWIPRSLASDELGAEGRLAIAGSSEWAVDVKIVLVRPRSRMTELAEKFWAAARSAVR